MIQSKKDMYIPYNIPRATWTIIIPSHVGTIDFSVWNNKAPSDNFRLLDQNTSSHSNYISNNNASKKEKLLYILTEMYNNTIDSFCGFETKHNSRSMLKFNPQEIYDYTISNASYIHPFNIKIYWL